jgi:hypothetical protein
VRWPIVSSAPRSRHRTARRLLALVGALATWSAGGQVIDPEIFGDGHVPLYKEEEIDRRFLKTGIHAALEQLPKEASCQRIVATLLVAYSDAMAYLHRRDQSFYVDPALLQTLDRTVSSDQFPARAYLASMIRRTLIDKKVPAAWIRTGEILKKSLQAPIETQRMQLQGQGISPIDSFFYTEDALLNRYGREVKRATSVDVSTAEERFRDKYMNRDVAWGGLVLHDIARQLPAAAPAPAKKHGKHAVAPAPAADAGPEPLWAILGFPVGPPLPTVPGIPGGGQVPELEIKVRLADDPLIDTTQLARGQRVLVKGHLWDIAPNMAWVEVHDAYLFPDPDWSTWPGLALAGDVRACPIAINDLSPEGTRARPGLGPDPFVHTRD